MLRLLVLSLVVSLALSASVAGQGYLCAEGGGDEQAGTWAASVYGWMVQQAPVGDVVILGLSGSDAGMAATFLANGANSVLNLSVPAAQADNLATFSVITNADIVWIRGGDQAQYMAAWKDTLTESALEFVYANGGVIGGTSAGAAILSDLVYDAAVGSLTPREALRNPYHANLTFDTDFLDFAPDTLFDTHFTERGRIGRLAVMVARRFEDTGDDILGIGIDDRTALCIYPDLTAEVRGEGAVTFLERSASTRQELAAGLPPSITDLSHHQLTEGYVYDLDTRTVLTRPAGATLVAPPTTDPDFTALSLSGSNGLDNDQGDVSVSDQRAPGNSLALLEGALTVTDGNNSLLSTVISTATWGSTTWDENRVGGPQYALALNPHFLALYLDFAVRVDTLVSDHLVVRPPVSGAETSTVLLDSHGLTSTAFSTYVSSGASVGPRQSVALEGAHLQVLASGQGYDARDHLALDPKDQWTDLGEGVAGVSGIPVQSAEGLLLLGTDVDLKLVAARPNAPAFLITGSTALNFAGFYGGTLVPDLTSPGGLLLVLVTGPGGGYALNATMPAALPEGFQFYVQTWIDDPAAPFGFAGSNAIVGTVP